MENIKSSQRAPASAPSSRPGRTNGPRCAVRLISTMASTVCANGAGRRLAARRDRAVARPAGLASGRPERAVERRAVELDMVEKVAELLGFLPQILLGQAWM